ncbi:hypothetical protein AU467_32385 [Mesorhizobium loti]|uniref:Fibronectin type-III domain-containing protein n=1 Tax=Rhizobium loti TaxID=381 RepID=A0A101KNK8_RHILI|nr:hypothetical protein AU467_32385 [Mesorhizobium loti]
MATSQIAGAGGTATSFSNTPQAQNDVFNYTEDNVVILSAAQSIILLDVLANDLGGNAKTLYSIDDGTSATTATKQYAPIDLTTQDVQATGISAWEGIGGGVLIRINNGKVEMDLSGYLALHGFSSLQALGAGDHISETFTYAIKLGNGTLSWASVSVNIQGTNDGATITATPGADSAVVEAGGVANGTPGDPGAHGQLIISDVDAGQNHFQAPASLLGTYGTFTFDTATGAWTYALNQTLADPLTQGQHVTDTLQVTSADGTASYGIVVNITGTNDAAVLSSASVNLTEGNTAAAISTGGNLTISDVDSPATFVAQAGTVGSYGTFAINAAGAWTYTASSAHNEFIAGQHYIENFDVVSADGTHTSVHINILGTNDAAVITGDATGSVTEASGVLNGTAGTSPATGDLDASDVDSATDFSVVTNGVHGTLSINAAGEWSYALNEDDAAVQALNVGDPALTDTITVQTSDGTQQNIVISINGANDAAVITVNGVEDTSVTEKSGVANGTPGDPTASGDLNATDVDNAATFNTQTAIAKNYGTFSIDANGTWSYTLDDNNAAVQALNSTGANTTLHELVTVSTVDGTQQVIDITIHGANDAAVITVNGAQDISVTEKGGVANGTPGDASASGDLNATDVDNAATFNTQTGVAKSYGTFSIDANGTWSYTLDDNNATVQALNSSGANTTLHELVTVSTVDGTQQVIDITIHGANDAAVLSSASVNLTEGNTAADISTSGTLTISDVDSPATFAAQAGTVGSYGTFAINSAGAWTYTASSAHDEFVAGQHYTENFDVVSADGTHTSVAIDILGTDDGPARFAPTDIQLTPSTTTGDINFSSFQFTGTLTATDPDPGSFVYSITSQSDPGLFSISGSTLSSSLSGLSPSKAYSITVQATQVGDPAGPAYQYSETFQVITGSNGNSSDGLNGANGGDDVLYGNGGADIILGMAGNDTLFGQSGNDTLNGGDGNDRLVGGVGADTLTGGLGADTFYYGSAISDSPVGAGNDTITDFVHGVDKIDLSSIDANTASGGDQAFLFGGQNAATVANSITWSEVGGNTIVHVDVNGNTSADFQITLTGINLGLTASDFVL